MNNYIGLYNSIYAKNYQFFASHPKLKKGVYLLDKIFTFAVAFAYVLLIFFALLIDRRTQPQDFIRLFAFPALCLFLTTILRLLINAKRPYERGVEPLFPKNRQGKSFPSRHLSCAATIATVSFFYSPLIGVCATISAATLFYTRFACGWHYPRDLFCGALLGVACSLPIFFI